MDSPCGQTQVVPPSSKIKVAPTSGQSLVASPISQTQVAPLEVKILWLPLVDKTKVDVIVRDPPPLEVFRVTH